MILGLLRFMMSEMNRLATLATAELMNYTMVRSIIDFNSSLRSKGAPR